jgi:hypothetical protein
MKGAFMPGQGFVERAKIKTTRRAERVIAKTGHPEPVLVGARVQSGLSEWWNLLSAYATLFRTYYFMALTERNVVLIRISRWTGQPKNVKIVTPRNKASISDYDPGNVFASFLYTIPDHKKPIKMRAGRGWRPEVESMIGQLNSGYPDSGWGPYGGNPAYGEQPGPFRPYGQAQ